VLIQARVTAEAEAINYNKINGASDGDKGAHLFKRMSKSLVAKSSCASGTCEHYACQTLGYAKKCSTIHHHCPSESTCCEASMTTFRYEWWSLSHNLCMSPAGGVKNPGTQVVTRDCRYALGWKLINKQIKLECSNLCLRVNGASPYKGAKAELAHCNSGDIEQLFRYEEDHLLKFDWSFQHGRNTMCMEVDGCNGVEGHQLQLWEGCNGNNCYWWSSKKPPATTQQCTRTDCQGCVDCLNRAANNVHYHNSQCGECLDPDSRTGCANGFKVCYESYTACFKNLACQDGRICSSWKLIHCPGFALIDSATDSSPLTSGNTMSSITPSGEAQQISSSSSMLDSATDSTLVASQSTSPSTNASGSEGLNEKTSASTLIERLRRTSEESNLDYAVASKCAD